MYIFTFTFFAYYKLAVIQVIAKNESEARNFADLDSFWHKASEFYLSESDLDGDIFPYSIEIISAYPGDLLED